MALCIAATGLVAPSPQARPRVHRGGGVIAFGDAAFAGNIGPPATAPCMGIVAAPGGYRLVDSRGNVLLR